MPKPAVAKTLIGYSDITALHLFLSQHWGWKTIHGSGFADLLKSDKNPDNFDDFFEKSVFTVQPLNTQASAYTTLTGIGTGGNLTLVQNSIGTGWQMQSAGKIVFLEDVNEQGYRIDRSLTHLKQAGLLQDAQAVVFGEFVACSGVEAVLQRFANEHALPVFQTDQFGHGYTNLPIPYNREIMLRYVL
jgi:muramoyltetrapeptide carboxypeptidase